MTEALKALEKFLGYPFPIAFVLKTEVLEGKTPKEQVDGLIRLAETALQYATLIAVSDYACAEFKDERVSHRLERLRRPLTSDFANFLRIAVPILEKHNALFVPELAEAIKKGSTKGSPINEDGRVWLGRAKAIKFPCKSLSQPSQCRHAQGLAWAMGGFH